MLSDLQTKKLTRYFDVYDIDDDGRIGAADFERILENVRILRGEREGTPGYAALRGAYMDLWASLSTWADVDSDGGVDLEEWLAYWQIVLEDDDRSEAEVAALADRLFRVFDTDEDGEIGPDEFSDFYGVFGLGEDLARSVFMELDLDGDSVITRDELLEIAAQFYRSDDPGAAGNVLFGPFGV